MRARLVHCGVFFLAIYSLCLVVLEKTLPPLVLLSFCSASAFSVFFFVLFIIVPLIFSWSFFDLSYSMCFFVSLSVVLYCLLSDTLVSNFRVGGVFF